MALNMEYLSHFIVAAEYLNFTMAAERLFMSQSTLSRQIKDLEDECGVPLFVRNGRTVTLTRAGQALYDAGRPLLAHLNQVTEQIIHSGANADGRITIFSVPAYFEVLTEVYRSLRDQGCNVEVCLNHMQQQDPVALLETDTVDFLITYAPFLREDSRHVRIPFLREGFCAVCSPTHPFAQRESVTLEECLRERVLFGKDFPLMLRQGPDHVNPGILPEGTSRMTLPSYYAPVSINEGILILPASSAQSYVSTLRYIPIRDEDLYHDLLLVYRKTRHLTPAMKLFISELEQACKPYLHPQPVK